MRNSQLKFAAAFASLLIALPASAQVNSGSDGSDGAFNPTANIVIDMADHPDGIYHYTSVNIPNGVTVSFKPNSANRPVVWLVQGDCKISGIVSLSGKASGSGAGALGGPGGYRGGAGGGYGNDGTPETGSGLGGGAGMLVYDSGSNRYYGYGGSGSFGTSGTSVAWPQEGSSQAAAGTVYGNKFLLPILGGSGGGGSPVFGGGGGGGSILVAAGNEIVVTGSIIAKGGDPQAGGGSSGAGSYKSIGGPGSGGGVRLVATTILGLGQIDTSGGRVVGSSSTPATNGGKGRVRFDANEINFGGTVIGELSQGFQPIIIQAPGQGIQLDIESVAGTAIAANPSGALVNPDVIIPAQKTNPIPIVVKCTNVPLNSEITVVVQPANGSPVQAVGLNNAGNLASSTATVSINMPRGGGIIYAKAVADITGLSMNGAKGERDSIASTGWTAGGEGFKSIEITASLGGAQKVAYITTSGKRYEIN